MSRPAKPEWLRQCVLAGKPFSFKAKTPWKHNLINLSVFAAALCLVAAVCTAGLYIAPLPYVLLASPVLGFAFFCLYVLVIHEASHGMFLLADKHKTRIALNRAFGWPVSLFFFTHYGKLWEVGHLEHHVRPIEENDPQSLNRVTGPKFFLGVLALLFVPGYVFIQRVFVRSKLQQKGSSWWIPFVSLAIFGSIGAALGVAIGWWVPLAMLMGMQILSALNELKGALEHGGEIAFHPEPLLRSRTSLFTLRPLVMPLNISMHFEHHLNHTVPWYELVNYHRAILPLVPEEIRDNLFNRDLISQVLGKLPAPYTDEMREAGLHTQTEAEAPMLMPAAAE